MILGSRGRHLGKPNQSFPQVILWQSETYPQVMVKPEHISRNHERILVDQPMDQLGGINGSMIPDESHCSGLGSFIKPLNRRFSRAPV